VTLLPLEALRTLEPPLPDTPLPNFPLPNFPLPNFAHLLAMTDERGTFEHALFAEPRPEHGYCTDDMARLLIVATRQSHPTTSVRRLAEISLRFLSDAQGAEGDVHNRMSSSGRWSDHRTLEDCWGRSLCGLGTASSHSDVEWVRQYATAQFERSAHRRSPWSRATAFAAVGAAELLTVAPDNRVARGLVIDAANSMASPDLDASWPWPEQRLTYANAVVPEAMIAAGTVLDRVGLVEHGLELLAWLLDHESIEGHLSVTPVGGARAGDVGPAFDQQPIEVAALADACARASTVDASLRWADGIASAVAWFLGDNDGHRVMWDSTTGGGFDGLERDGVNRNQGTESTLALLSTLQHGRCLTPITP
jgi:hypothetical protein